MSHPYIVPLTACADAALVGGKAVGLQRLIREGLPVPSGFCLTTAAYRDRLQAIGFDATRRWRQARAATGSDRDRLLSDCRQAILSCTIDQAILRALGDEPARRAVRSSATDEDAADATFAGLYATVLDVPADEITAAILHCWASIWTPAVAAYHERLRRLQPPMMAVILQPMLAPQAAGVAYSRHPVTGRSDVVVINAVRGLAEPLVSGQAIPDQLVVQTGGAPAIVERSLADGERTHSVLADTDALRLAEQTRAIEGKLGHPVDIEWALAGGALWFLQARAIPQGRAARLTEAVCVWSRANFKETLPEVPSPLGLSFLHEFMERAILTHYRTLGCSVPPGVSVVRVIRGRPYINVSLFQHFMAQLGGNPDSITDQMGGEPHPLPVRPKRLAWWRLLRAGLWMEWQIRRAARLAPGWFTEMKRMADESLRPDLRDLTPAQLVARLDRLGERLYAGDLTFATVGGVSQGLYLMQALLVRRLGRDWRALMNASVQGESHAISARQIQWLMELAQEAAREPRARSFLLADPWRPESFRAALAGTRFLARFDEYLSEYGHRAVGESDVMAPRFAEMPHYPLGIVREYVKFPPARSVAEMTRAREEARAGALRRIRAAFGWRLHEWWLFGWGRRRLARYFALREANRHALMHFSAATRRMGLLMAGQLTAQGLLAAPDDCFFLTSDELRELARGAKRDWPALVRARRTERARHETMTVPDLVIGTAGLEAAVGSSGSVLTGMAIGAGVVEGPVRLLRAPADREKVRTGDILVVPVIDPGLAPLFGLIGGLVGEMGGTLSHGAIIAREYGLPTIANVPGVTRCLKDGERVRLDATRGEISRLDP